MVTKSANIGETTEDASRRTDARPPARTRERLLAAALRLFAAQGYAGTSVGEIEREAGLVPRRGALYKHFESKRALVDAALAERLEAIDRIGERIGGLGGADLDLEPELRAVAEITLDELERERDLARLVMKEGDRFADLTRGFHAAIVERGHGLGRLWLAGRTEALGLELADPDATAQVLVDAMVGYALQGFLFDAVVEPFDRERFIDAWVRLALAILEPGGGRSR